MDTFSLNFFLLSHLSSKFIRNEADLLMSQIKKHLHDFEERVNGFFLLKKRQTLIIALFEFKQIILYIHLK